MTYHHFYHILLITMWARIIQGYEYQEAGITGDPSGKGHHMDFRLILLALPHTSHMYLYVCPERGPFYLCFSSMISNYGCTSPKFCLPTCLSFDCFVFGLRQLCYDNRGSHWVWEQSRSNTEKHKKHLKLKMSYEGRSYIFPNISLESCLLQWGQWYFV